jgi:hypothetical protein
MVGSGRRRIVGEAERGYLHRDHLCGHDRLPHPLQPPHHLVAEVKEEYIASGLYTRPYQVVINV